jgi:hypothetical protein
MEIINEDQIEIPLEPLTPVPTPTQNGYIEKIIPQFFRDPGFYIEIGCWDGMVISQTHFLEQSGWKGICVDPFPSNFDKRNCVLVNKAIDGLLTGNKNFIKVTIDRRYGGDVSYLSGFRDSISSSEANWSLIKEHCDYSSISVPTLSVKDFFNLNNIPNYVHFLSIDTEGSEPGIFSNIDYEKYEFGVITFEHNHNYENKNFIGDILRKNGYEMIREDDYDDVYANIKLLNQGLYKEKV